MPYTLPSWQDSPSTATPLNSANLLELNAAINDLDTRALTTQTAMTVTAVKTANYTAGANQIVPVDTTSGTVTVTFPTAPADKTRVGAKQVVRGGSNTVILALGGSDHFNTTTGPTTGALTLLNQAAVFQYVAATSVWINVSDDLPLSQLDARYVASVSAGDSTITVGGTATAPTVAVNAIAESKVTNLTSDLAGKTDKSTLTTKGDLYVASAASTPARQGIGLDGQVLTADSTQTTGVKWATPATGGGGGAVNSVTAGDSTITIAGTATNPTVAVNTIAESKVTNLTTDLAAKAPLASPSFTGTTTVAKLVETPVALTDAATITVDASLGNLFRVTLGGNRTVGAPSNPTDGQEITFVLLQDATGGRTVTWTSGAGGYQFDAPTPTLQTAANKRDFVRFVYNTAANAWVFCPTSGAVTGVTAANTTITVAGTVSAPTVAVNQANLTVAESQVTNLTTDLAAKAPTASPTFTGTVTVAKMVETPVNLTFVLSGTTAVDAGLGNTFRLAMGAGTTALGAPANPTDGQMIILAIKQDTTGSRTVTWATGAGGYTFGTDVPQPTLTATGSKTDYIGFIYNSTANSWHCLAVARGY
jgi:hypothetical protein